MDNMQRRAAGLGATLEVESDAGGTRVILDLPRSVVRAG
jgi:signal transduction histidine kinase